MIGFCAQAATEANTSWHEYKAISLPAVTQSRLDTKLKLLELVSLRQWNIVDQTSDSFKMSLNKCNIKIIFTDEAITINQDNLNQEPVYNGQAKRPLCSRNWLSNIAKDINTTLNIMSIQQQAINLEKANNTATK
ncbi:hypothetical protein VHA01S_026_00260 [Vibrio halioticoli NBRC 102217]|uniref:Uncharacterized protein n=2 Tax=Vibrio halioticoli TaxID=71388 RepID=V5HKF0_9VIBR|nr:hypothetical protein VHA01S_026_00260 [Vibrio halioticoli NBRC 102217]